MKVEVAVLGSTSPIVRTVPMDVKNPLNLNFKTARPQELCESGGGRPGLHVPNKPYGLYGCKKHTRIELEL